MKKIKQDSLMIFFKRLLVPHMQTGHRRCLPLFQYHVQAAWNCITCLRIKNQDLQNLTFVFVTKPNQTESLSLLYVSTVQISGRIVFSQPSKPKETSPTAGQYIGIYSKGLLQKKLFLLSFVWGRRIASLLLVSLKN